MSVAEARAKSSVSGPYEREDLLNGCQAVAQGVRLADVDVKVLKELVANSVREMKRGAMPCS